MNKQEIIDKINKMALEKVPEREFNDGLKIQLDAERRYYKVGLKEGYSLASKELEDKEKEIAGLEMSLKESDKEFNAMKKIADQYFKEIERLKEALEQIAEQKYPENIFIPLTGKDWKKVKDCLAREGMSLDALSAEYGRIFHKMHQDIATEALQSLPKTISINNL